MSELMKFLDGHYMLIAFLTLWSLFGVFYSNWVEIVDRSRDDNNHGRCLTMFLYGPATWIIEAIYGLFYLLAAILRIGQVGEAVKKYFSK